MTDHLTTILATFERVAAERDDEAGDAAAARLLDLGLQRDEIVLDALERSARLCAATITELVGPSPLGDVLMGEAHRCHVQLDLIRGMRA